MFKLTDFLFKKFDLGVIDWTVNAIGDFTVFLSWLKERFDTLVVDGAVNGLGYVVRGTGAGIRKVQTGQLQNYAFIIFFGIVLIILLKIF
jgi:NADH-quinone oxidoreductase subunit L